MTREELERLALDAVGPEDAYQLWDSIEETSDEDLLLLIEKNTSRIATKPVYFMLSQIKVAAIHTRFDAVEWFIWDAGQIDELTGHPEVVGQYATEQEAIDRAKSLADAYEAGLFADYF